MSFTGRCIARWMRAAVLVAMLGLLVATPVSAAQETTGLPPLPQWPIIGPLLRMLGLIKPATPAPPPRPTPDPTLPEYHITTLEDLRELQELEEGEKVRVVLAEEDTNEMIAQILKQQATASLSFEQGYVMVQAFVDQSLLKQMGVDLPDLGDGELEIRITLTIQTSDCQPVITLNKVEVNGWSMGLRSVAQRALDDRLPHLWPTEACLEAVFLTPGQLAIEGYRR
ncbi:MAG TPA: hypothetical protein ENL34_14320 [Chloroflexi bacterium]|nr:hypothetical protein [Chloroflexota bacterium]